MSGHALLSPSSASRWMVCPPSARMAEKYPNRDTKATAEGTLAHKLGELMLLRELKIIAQSTFDKELVQIKKTKFKDEILYNAEMHTHCEEYRDYVMEMFNEAKARDPQAEIFIEEQIDLSFYIPEGFGTGDVQIIAEGVLDFIDLKYGKGVKVDAIDNAQLRSYAAGSLRRFDLLYDVNKVRMHIFQPRLDNIDVEQMNAADLRKWAKDELKPAAEKAFNGEGQHTPGEKQCFFCPAKHECRALAEYNLELAKHSFKDPFILEDVEVSDILARADMFIKWIGSVRDHALLSAVNDGKQWPGYKVVTGRSNRIYRDQKQIGMVLNGAGISDFYKPLAIKGITELTAQLGKARFEELLKDYIVKPEGKPVLVPENDKREPWKGDAASVFADIDEDFDI